MSVVPGFHKHCRCKLVPVDQVTSGMVFSCQFPYLTMEDILNAISVMFAWPEPDFHHSHHQEVEGASDIVPYSPSRADILQAISTEIQLPDNTAANSYHGQ